MIFLYVVLMAAAIHNIVQFVYKQRRYRFFHIVYFYILLPLIIVMRMVWFAMILSLTYKYINATNHEFETIKENIFIFDVSATYLELLLGIQQVSSMFELYLMISVSVI